MDDRVVIGGLKAGTEVLRARNWSFSRSFQESKKAGNRK
jgi:hypothetical protein